MARCSLGVSNAHLVLSVAGYHDGEFVSKALMGGFAPGEEAVAVAVVVAVLGEGDGARETGGCGGRN